MLSVLIVDDEVDARNVMRTILRRHCPMVSKTVLAETAEEAILAIHSQNFDIVFLDIHLHSGTEGLDVAAALQQQHCKIVFVTAHEQYALEAFKLRAHHYLLKPIDILELRDIVEEIALEQSAPKAVEEYRLQVNSANGMVLIREKDIIRIEGDGSYSKIYFKEKPPVLVSRNLGKLIDDLRSKNFLRIHQSHLINLQKVTGFLKNQFVELTDGSKVPVSRRKKEELMARLT